MPSIASTTWADDPLGEGDEPLGLLATNGGGAVSGQVTLT
jgi:hypothetical protein